MKTLFFLLLTLSLSAQGKKMVLIEGFQGHEIEVNDSITYSTVKEFYKWSDRLHVDFETKLIGLKSIRSVPMATFKNHYFDRGLSGVRSAQIQQSMSNGSQYKPVKDINGDYFIFEEEYKQCGLGLLTDYVPPIISDIEL